MYVMTTVECPAHDEREEAVVDTRSGEAHVMCGGVTVYLDSTELADILAD